MWNDDFHDGKSYRKPARVGPFRDRSTVSQEPRFLNKHFSPLLRGDQRRSRMEFSHVFPGVFPINTVKCEGFGFAGGVRRWRSRGSLETQLPPSVLTDSMVWSLLWSVRPSVGNAFAFQPFTRSDVWANVYTYMALFKGWLNDVRLTLYSLAN